MKSINLIKLIIFLLIFIFSNINCSDVKAQYEVQQNFRQIYKRKFMEGHTVEFSLFQDPEGEKYLIASNSKGGLLLLKKY